MQNLQPFIDSLQKFAQKRLGFEDPPKLFLKQDQENAKNVFGKTAHYDPSEKSITIFTTGRHPKDILRSIAHELVHHCQNLRGDLNPEKCGDMSVGYAQQNDHMREMEREAYEKGNLCFRDWEDGIKVAMQQENNQLKENKKMVKISKKELKGLIKKIVETRLEKEQVSEEVEELEEGGCVPKAKRDDKELEEKKKKCCGKDNCKHPRDDYLIKEEELEEGKGKKKKCPHCDEDAPKSECICGKIKENEELEEGHPLDVAEPHTGKPDAKDFQKLRADAKAKKNESKIQTPEQEKRLYESRFNKRNEEIFDKLKKLWTK